MTDTNRYGLQQEGICYEKRRQDAFSCLRLKFKHLITRRVVQQAGGGIVADGRGMNKEAHGRFAS